MALSTTPADAPLNSQDREGLSLQILSPSFEATGRISFRDVPTETTVADLKTMIASALVTRPPPESQRLIYRGKQLSNNQEKLVKILELGNGEIHSIHLVLPPGTLLQRTVASEPSLISHREQQNATRPEILRPQRIRDLLNPAPTPSGMGYELRDGSSSTQDVTANRSGLSAPDLSSTAVHSATQAYSDSGIDVLNRGSTLLSAASHAAATRSGESSTIHNPRRAVSTFDSTSSQTGLQGLHVNYASTNLSRSSIDVSSTQRLEMHRSTARRVTSNPICPNARNLSPAFSIGTSQMEATRLTVISQRIVAMEERIHHGLAPTVDEIAGVRFQLYQMVDEQHRNPLNPREPALDGWLARVSSLATRADQLRVMQARQQLSGNHSQNIAESPIKSSTPSNTTYLLKAPNGNHYLMMRPQEHPTQPTIRLRAPTQTPHIPGLLGANAATVGAPGLVTGLPANRVFRQPLVRRRYRTIGRPIDVGAVLRSLWLFVRLYFFSYLFSAQGTWLRTILVMASAVIAIFSETEFPGRARRLIISPVQQHLENLLPLNDQQRQETQAPPGRDGRNTASGNRPPSGAQGPPVMVAGQGGIWEGLRSLERSIAIFIASFVPGLSERHIAARNAAEAARLNAEQERQQEQNPRGEGNADDTTQRHASDSDVNNPTTETGSSAPGIDPIGNASPDDTGFLQQSNQQTEER